MFDTFSQRARQAVFAARWRTGQRGAEEMCLEDLVVGLIIEDQGMIENLFLEIHREHRLQSILPVKAHISFFPSGLAAQILTRIEELLPHSKPVSASRELPISSDLKLAFEAAKNFQRKFQQRHIAPRTCWLLPWQENRALRLTYCDRLSSRKKRYWKLSEVKRRASQENWLETHREPSSSVRHGQDHRGA